MVLQFIDKQLNLLLVALRIKNVWDEWQTIEGFLYDVLDDHRLCFGEVHIEQYIFGFRGYIICLTPLADVNSCCKVDLLVVLPFGLYFFFHFD